MEYKDTVIGCAKDGFSVTGGDLYPSVLDKLNAYTDLYEACLTFQTALAIWRQDPSKAPNTLTAIFKETIGKAIAKANQT